MENIHNSFMQSTFSRSLHNEAKLGAYYTDIGHCERLGRLFLWPDEEVAALEPSIGDGEAIKAVMKDCNQNTIFGVELNSKSCVELKGKIPYLLNADFLHGVKISNRAFSFCFANPPYGVDQDNNERLEKQFVEKIFGYMKVHGILALVIPYHVLTDEKVLKSYMARFSPLATYRFDDDEYRKYKQVVVIGKRRNSIGCYKKWLLDYMEKIKYLDDIPYLPLLTDDLVQDDLIPVPPSAGKDVEYFTTLIFNAETAGKSLKDSPLYSLIAEKGMPQEYTAAKLGRPAVPLKKDLLYICALSGGGQGLIGSAETQDLHLQRGVVRIETDNDVRVAQGGRKEVVETTYSKIALNIIENDGTITVLQ